MFDILMYLFENYVHSESDVFVEQSTLTDELLRAGFNKPEINKAIDWLDQLAALQYSNESPYLLATPVLFLVGGMLVYSRHRMSRLFNVC